MSGHTYAREEGLCGEYVTLSLPRNLLQEFKVLAARRGTSMSAILAGMIADAVHQEDQ
jgi:metal-responsive CopG/Arc/MetJ family transcriptional regulator